MSGLALCILAAGQIMARLPTDHFTLRWQHSVEKVPWEEDYRLTREGLLLAEARVRGSGAGMEPPPGAELVNGVWHYRPQQASPLPRLELARSRFVADYTLCVAGRCAALQEIAPALGPDQGVALAPCAAP